MDYMTWCVVVCIRLHVTYAPVDVANIGSGILNAHSVTRLFYDQLPGFGGCPTFAKIHPP